MSTPRYYPPGAHTYMVTRRVAQRALRLTPTDPDPDEDLVRRAFLFCLAWAATAFGVEIHAAVVMGNHWNDGLVDRPEDWPGLRTTVEDVGVTVLVGRKPGWFFRAPKENEPESTVPDRVEIRVTKPPAFAHLTDEAFRDLLRGRVEQRLAEIRQEREAQGKLRSLGADAVLAQDPFSCPGPTQVDLAVTPRAACKDKWRRIEALTTLKTFFAEYRAAWRAWADARTEEARRTIVFPAGTYWMRRVYGVTCAPAPT